MVQPSLDLTLIDSVRKKVDFQRHILRMLSLKGIDAIHGRVQEGEIIQRMECRFDAIISRAFSDLRTLLALSYPFLKKEGMVLAMKGKADREEMEQLTKTEGIPYTLKNTFHFVLPFTALKRSILLFEKE